MATSAHPYGNPNFDFFTALSGIGDTLADNRQRNAVSDALTGATWPDGTIDFGAAMTGALKAGDIKTATALRTFAERQYNQDNARDFDLAENATPRSISDRTAPPTAQFPRVAAPDGTRIPLLFNPAPGFNGTAPPAALQPQNIPATLNGKELTKLEAGAPSAVGDSIKSIPRGVLAGLLNAATTGAQAEAHAMSQPDLAADIPNTEQALTALEPVTGTLYQPQTTAGKVVVAGARAVGNPVSYVAPGGPLLNGLGVFASGAGSELAGRLASGTRWELPARLAGSLAGAGLKHFEPKATAARVPTPTRAQLEAGKVTAAEQAALLDRNGMQAWLGSTSGGGLNVTEAMKQRIAEILQNPDLRRGYSFRQLVQMQKIVQGAGIENELVKPYVELGDGVRDLALTAAEHARARRDDEQQ